MKTPVRKIIVVFKTHFDIGFTGLASEIIRSYGAEMLPEVVHTCTATRAFPEGKRFVWTMPAWPLFHCLESDDADEETKRNAAELIRQNQIHWHALPFTTHTEFCGLEEFIRGFYFSGRLSAKFGKRPVAAKMTDVPGHTRMLPSLLRKAGVEFLHLGCNPFSTPPDVPRIFNWEGPDGSRVITFYNKGEYGSSLMPPEDWPFPVWLALMSTNDNEGPQKPETIRRILDEVRETMPDAEVVMGTLDDFLAEMRPYADQLPVVRGDLADTWIHGVGSYPDVVGTIRLLRQKLAGVEKAFALGMAAELFALEEAEELKRLLDSAYEECILFGEHTFGLDVKQMGENREYRKDRFEALKSTPLYRRMEQSWEEKRDRVRNAVALTERVHRAVIERWAAAGAAATGDTLLVFNGEAWDRDGWVPLDGTDAIGKIAVDAATGNPLAVAEMDGRKYVRVENVPALGFKAVALKEKGDSLPEVRAGRAVRVSEQAGTIENDWCKIVVDRDKGCLISLFDKMTGHEWIDASHPTGFGQYDYDVYGDEDVTEFIRSYAYRFYTWGVIDFGRAGYPRQKRLTYVPGRFRLEAEKSENSATLTLTADNDPESVELYGNAPTAALSVTLYAHEPYVDLTFRLNGKRETPFVEAGHLSFPLRLPGARYAVHKLGQVVDPATDIVANANHALYCCDRWVDVSDGEKGIAFIPLDTPLFSIGEKGILKFRRTYEEREPILRFNLFNNSWGTNFPQWMGGDYTFRYRLYPHRGDWLAGEVARAAAEAFSPLLSTVAVSSSPRPANAETFGGRIRLEDGMELLALKPAENGDGLILRVHDIKGKKRTVRLSFAEPCRLLQPCDLLETDQGAPSEQVAEYEFETRPFEVHSFRLRL